MNRRSLFKQLAVAGPSLLLAEKIFSADRLKDFSNSFNEDRFQPTWDSLAQFEAPGWYQDAKFGVKINWGPHRLPGLNDSYSRDIYVEGSPAYKHHLSKFGHPSEFGFKDLINTWKAEGWNPDELVALFKTAGAKYVYALANHYDNFDLYNSRHHKWNSVNLGPKKDLLGQWQKATRKNGLYFGAGVHAAQSWNWYNQSVSSDQHGAKKGHPYDGSGMARDGQGKWWQGYDPQELYVQQGGVATVTPCSSYCDKFYRRTIDLIDSYEPDLLYFDDKSLPLWPTNDTGLKLAAYMYNKSIFRKGSMQAVITVQAPDQEQLESLIWNKSITAASLDSILQDDRISELPWQMETYLHHTVESGTTSTSIKQPTSKELIITLADVCSKNGNLLCTVSLNGDGSLDNTQKKILAETGDWLKKYGDALYDTRPWKRSGEGRNVRYTAKGDFVYAYVLDTPAGTNNIEFKSLAVDGPENHGEISAVEIAGNRQPLVFKRNAEALRVELPENLDKSSPFALRIVP